MRQFCTPHCHPMSLDSASTPEAFAAKEVELGSGALCCTDHGSLSAAYKTFELAKKNKLIPTIGLEFYFRDDNCPILTKLGVPKTETVPRGMDKDKWKLDHPDGSFYDYLKYFHGTLGFQTYDAYLKGVKLLSKADDRAEVHGSERKPLFTWEDIEELAATQTTLGSSCFVPGTLVRTDRGPIPIQDVVVGDYVMDCGKWIKVDDTTCRVYDGEVSTVMVSEATSPIICTSDHRFLAYVNMKEEWVQAKKLGRGDLLVTSCFPLQKEAELEGWKNEDLWILGLFLAEGSWGSAYVSKHGIDHKFGKAIQFSLNKKETQSIARVESWAKSYGSNVYIGGKKESLGIDVRVSSLELAEKFGNLFGERVHAATKYVPRKILELPIDKLRFLMDGYFTGDGHLCARVFNHKKTGPYSSRRAVVASVSEKLILDMCSILQRADLGYNVGVGKAHVGADGTPHRDAYYLRMSGSEAQAFVDWIRKDVVRSRVSGRTLSTVSKVVYSNYSGMVHCLSVSSNRFALASGVMVHNCLVGMVSRHLVRPESPASLKVGAAKAYFERLHHLFGDRFYVEVFPHRCTHDFVKGVFIEHYAEGYISGVEKPVTSRYYYGKTLRTTEGEFKAEELADKWNPKKPQKLLAVKDFRAWKELEYPRVIASVRKQEGFVQNECSPASPEGDIQWGANKFAMGMAKKYNIPILVSDDSHFCDASQKIVQDVKLSQMGDWRMYGSYHRMSSHEAYDYFKTQHNTTEKEFESWVDNSYKWADGFKDFKFDNTVQLPTKFFPEDTLAHTKLLIEKHGRMPKNDPRYLSRLKQEIQLFHKNGTVDLLSYFFVDEEVCELYSNSAELTGPGRGSACGTLLAYLLGITHVDPLQYDLSLERFLTLDRIKSGRWPDIDLDLPSRDLLVEFLEKRYGDCFAQISVMTTLKLSSAVRDVARFSLGNVPPDIEDLCKRFEKPPQGLSDIKFIMGYTNDEGAQSGSIERDQALQAYVSKYPEQWEIVKNALALPRQRGRHASAFIIASKPISDFIPITTVSDVKVTAFTGSEVEAIGGLKMDWLVVSCLNDIQKCIQLTQSRHTSGKGYQEININGRKVPSHRLVLNPLTDMFEDIWNLPADNEVFNDVSTGKTETVFQFNTNSAVQWLKHFNFKRPNSEPAINSIDAMAIFTALDRPGPLNYTVSNPDAPSQRHNIMCEYARRVRGLKGSEDILSIFDKLLPETNSLMVFQEGLQKVYQELTGCSGSEAEQFRSNIAKKKKEKVDAAYKFFIEKASSKVGKEQAQQVWDSLVTFSAYGFNKSHATAYCVISYACAWLKHYYPLEWWCAVLSNANKDEIAEKFWPYVQNIVDLPDIKLSKPTWTIVGDRIRAPIDLCYGVGETAHAQLNQYAPYESKDDFCKKIVDYRIAGADAEGKWRRSAVTIGTIHTLLVAGILDSLFDPNTSIAERIDEYQALLKKHTVAAGKKYNKSKTKYPTLDALGRYQVRKEVLPPYSEDIRGYLLTEKNEALVPDGGKLYYKYKEWNRDAREETDQQDRIVGREEMVDMATAVELPQCGFRAAIVGYIESQKDFSYQNKSKTARKFFVDACGFKAEMVLWPGNDGRLPEGADKIKDGSIIVGTVTKTDLNKGFSFRKLQLIRGPIEREKDDEVK